MASFTPLLESISVYKNGPYHLMKDASSNWRVVLGPPAENEERLLDAVAKDLQGATLGLDELDALELGMRNLSLEPPQNRFMSLFKAAIKTEQTLAFSHLKQVLDSQFNRIGEGDLTSVKRWLEYLVQRDDITRFVTLYRIASERFHDELTLYLTELSQKPAFMSCMWLQRANDNFAWIRSLVPIAALKDVPKRLDLKDCEVKSISEVLQAHMNQGYSQLVLELTCSQQYLWHLIEKGDCACVIELDLQGCKNLTWRYTEQRLAQLPKLRCLHLPASLSFGTEGVMWSTHWKEECKAAVLPEVSRIQRQQEARKDFTFVTNLMRGVNQNRKLNYKNRVQLNLLLSASPEVLKTLRPLQTVSASGIQRVTAEMIIQLPLAEKNVDIFLSYCPLITKDAFRHLYSTIKLRLLNLYFWGCLQIEDSFFEGHPLLTQPNTFKGALMLVGTRVTNSMIKRLQDAQPQASIQTDPTFLSNLAKKKEATEIDRQGLSDEALDAILHLKYTGYFTPISVKCAKELIASQDTILASSKLRQALTRFCRYILFINVERSNVLDLYAFAEITNDSELKFVCRVFLETYMTPDLPAAWNVISDEDKKSIEVILKNPPLPVPSTDSFNEIFYEQWAPEIIDFSREARPLDEIVLFGSINYFLLRYEKMSAEERRACLAKYQARYPHKRWLKRLQEEPDWPKKVLPMPHATRQVLDLRSVESIGVRLLLRSCGNVPIEAALSFTDQDFLVLQESGAFQEVTFLDLRECEVTSWANLQTFLLRLPKLRNVILPTNLEPQQAEIRLSPMFSPGLRLLLCLNLMHQAALSKTKRTGFFLLSDRLPDTPVEDVANRALFEDMIDLPMDFPEPYVLNYLLQTNRPQIIQRLWPHYEINVSGMEATKSTLLQIRETKEYALNLSYCRSIDWEFLKGKKLTILSLFGCSTVCDASFTTIPEAKIIDLRGTCVTNDKVAELRQAGIQVLYDPEFLAAFHAGFKASRDHIQLSKEACSALNHYHYTGYFPLLTVPVAMELYSHVDDRGLKEHCLKYMLLNVTTEHALLLYRLAKDNNISSLLYVVRCYIEIFCNPYYPISLADAQKLAPFGEVLRDEFPAPRAIHTTFVLEKQKITEKPNLEVRNYGDKSANIDRQVANSDDDL